MTPLTKEVTAALARDDPTPKPCGAEPGEHVPRPPRRSPSPYPWSYELVACWAPLPRALIKPFCKDAGIGDGSHLGPLIFFALVAVGLVVLNLLAHRR